MDIQDLEPPNCATANIFAMDDGNISKHGVISYTAIPYTWSSINIFPYAAVFFSFEERFDSQISTYC